MNIFKLIMIAFFFVVTLDSKTIYTNEDVISIRKFDALGIEGLIQKETFVLFDDLSCDIELSHVELKRINEDVCLNLYIIQSNKDYVDFVIFSREESLDVILNYFIDRLEYINSGIELGYIHFNEDFMDFSFFCMDEYQLDSSEIQISLGLRYENRIFHVDRISANNYIIRRLKEYLSAQSYTATD